MADGMGQTTANQALQLIFNQTAWTQTYNIATNAASPLTNFYLALHSADPSTTGNQSTSEVSYTTYGRATVARTSGGFTITNNTVSLTSAVSFAACTAGSATATYWSVGCALSGAGQILYVGSISPSISIANGVTPQLAAGTIITQT